MSIFWIAFVGTLALSAVVLVRWFRKPLVTVDTSRLDHTAEFLRQRRELREKMDADRAERDRVGEQRRKWWSREE